MGCRRAVRRAANDSGAQLYSLVSWGATVNLMSKSACICAVLELADSASVRPAVRRVIEID
jgi:hypothetical protein